VKRAVTVAVLAALSTLSCKKTPEPTGSSSPFLPDPKPSAALPVPTAAPPPSAKALPPVEITWVDPPEWKRSERPNPMRKATYLIPRAQGDTEDGELGVFYFGPGQGGGIEANVDRWVKQFKDVPAERVRREDRTTNGMRTHVIEVQSGTFNANSMGHGGEKLKKNYALLGAIVEAPSGAYFFKLTGPKKTVTAAKKPFDALIASVKPG
jgi:hypothetical protein